MCDNMNRAKARGMGDNNSVIIGGYLGNLKYYRSGKGKFHAECDLTSTTSWGTAHRVRIEASGQSAHDLFMQYAPGHTVQVSGRIRAGRQGRFSVVMVGIVKTGGRMTVSDLETKIGMLRSFEEERREESKFQETTLYDEPVQEEGKSSCEDTDRGVGSDMECVRCDVRNDCAYYRSKYARRT